MKLTDYELEAMRKLRDREKFSRLTLKWGQYESSGYEDLINKGLCRSHEWTHCVEVWLTEAGEFILELKEKELQNVRYEI